MNKSLRELFFQFNNIGFYYPAKDGGYTPTIKNVNLKIEAGEWVAVIGRSGSGKTTIARLFCGLLSPSEGEILIEGRKMGELKKEGGLQRNVGYLFSDPENQIVYPIVEEDVAFGPTNMGFSSDEIKDRVNKALNLVGLEGYQKKTISLLSKVEMKKVAFAGILAMGPKALILDEPFLMLDPKATVEMIDIIDKLRGQGITVVSTISSLEEAAFCDRALILNKGEIILEGGFKKIISEKEIIENAGLDLPKITQLIYLLRDGGVSIPVETLDIDDVAGYLLNRKS